MIYDNSNLILCDLNLFWRHCLVFLNIYNRDVTPISTPRGIAVKSTW
jgi:hypothetical protein